MDGERLGKQLADLGRRLAELSALPAFRDEVLMAQERLVPRTGGGLIAAFVRFRTT